MAVQDLVPRHFQVKPCSRLVCPQSTKSQPAQNLEAQDRPIYRNCRGIAAAATGFFRGSTKCVYFVLTFIHLAYSTMAHLYETVPPMEWTCWIVYQGATGTSSHGDWRWQCWSSCPHLDRSDLATRRWWLKASSKAPVFESEHHHGTSSMRRRGIHTNRQTKTSVRMGSYK